MSDVYRSLPKSIASTIPKRTQYREKWYANRNNSSSDKNTDHELHSTIFEDDSVIYEPPLRLRRNSSALNLISKVENEEDDEDDMCNSVISRHEALCVTGQVRRHACYFEKFPKHPYGGSLKRQNEDAKSRFLGHRSRSLEYTSSNYDMIKYKTTSPFWKEYNERKSRSEKPKLDNLKKWDAVCFESVNSPVASKTDAFQEIGEVCANKVKTIKYKLLGEGAYDEDLDYNSETNDVDPSESFSTNERGYLMKNGGNIHYNDELIAVSSQPSSAERGSFQDEVIRSHADSFVASDASEVGAGVREVLVSSDDSERPALACGQPVVQRRLLDLERKMMVLQGKPDCQLLISDASNIDNSPKVIRADLKSFNDIPEELFNELHESSVDHIDSSALESQDDSAFCEYIKVICFSLIYSISTCRNIVPNLR